MEVRVITKLPNSENHWIIDLGTAARMVVQCNDNIDGKGVVLHPICLS